MNSTDRTAPVTLTAAECRKLFKARGPVTAKVVTPQFPRGKTVNAVAVAVLVTQVPGFKLVFDGCTVTAEAVSERYEIRVAQE